MSYREDARLHDEFVASEYAGEPAVRRHGCLEHDSTWEHEGSCEDAGHLPEWFVSCPRCHRAGRELEPDWR